MRIAQVAPIFERVPPKAYGGTERVVSYLTEELVRQGHDVTLFATGDSLTQARLVAPIAQSRRFNAQQQEWLMYQTIMMDQLSAMAHEFDFVHFHTDYLHFPLANSLPIPHLTTIHGRLDLPELVPLYDYFDAIPLCSISRSQRQPLPHANWQGTVYHGLPQDLYAFNPQEGAIPAAGNDFASRCGEYFAFIGRISPEKRVDRAIEIALACDMPLMIAAKVDHADQEYFEQIIQPLLQHPLITFIGEVGDADKQAFLGNACALLFPIDWPEPFGLVLIEALSCGTPIVAYRHGSVPEIVDDGVTGFIVDNQEQAIAAARRVASLDRNTCRATFERRFSATRMASDYLKLYAQLQLGRAASRTGSARACH